MKLTVNGAEENVRDALTVQGLLEALSIRAERVAVEVNEEVVKKVDHQHRVLQTGDRVEIVTFVGGG